MTPGETHMIKCAHCGHIATHQNKVEIFCREQDAETGTLVSVNLAVPREGKRPFETYGETDDPLVHTCKGSKLEGNPSWRRHGLTITLWCESNQCPPTLVHVYQHKGMTMFEVETNNPT